MEVSEKEADRFFANGAFSPTAQTAFILNLRSLEGVADRRVFVKLAAETSSTETDAIFCTQTAALMSKLHKSDVPLARITAIGSFPVCVAKDGSIVVALQWDYAVWTPTAAGFAEKLQRLGGESGAHKPVLVALSGQASPRLQEELQSRGFTLRDRLNPGPLK
jgi:uroporphyrinogen-III synthase